MNAVPTLDVVRLTEFWRRMDTRFGASYARSYAADQVLSTLGSHTVLQALAEGEDAFKVEADELHVLASDGRKVLLKATGDRVAVVR